MPKVSRKNCKFCKTLGCPYFTLDKHCSGCKSGLTERGKRFKRLLNMHINVLTKDSRKAIGSTVMETLSNLRKKDTFLRAKDIVKFCKGTYECNCFGDLKYAFPLDKLLMRVVDYWNIHHELGFCGSIHCYWNPYDDRQNTMVQLFSDREKIFTREGIKYVGTVSPHLREKIVRAMADMHMI